MTTGYNNLKYTIPLKDNVALTCIIHTDDIAFKSIKQLVVA